MAETSRKIHVVLDIRGALKNWTSRDWRRAIRDDTGRLLTAEEARLALIDKLAEGWLYLPIGGPCEGFDLKTGCPGHDVPASTETTAPEPVHA